MTSIGTGYDLSASQFSPDGRVFQIEYAGKAVVHLAADTNIEAKSGKIISTADLGREFGFVDINGKSPIDFRLSVKE